MFYRMMHSFGPDDTAKKTHRKGSSTLTSSLTLSQCSILSLDQDVLSTLVETLHLRQQSLGQNHPKVGESHNFIGNFHFRRGNYFLASENYRCAINCFQSSISSQFQVINAIVVTLTNLGISLWVQGHLEESINILEGALTTYHQSRHQIVDKVIDPCLASNKKETLSQLPQSDDLDIGVVYYNLSIVQYLKGDYESSKNLMEKAHWAWERLNGPSHITVARALDGLGKIQLARGNVSDARLLHETAFRTKAQVMGMRHSSTLFSMSNLASVYMNQAYYDKALDLLQSVLKIQEERLIEPNGRNPSNFIDVGNTLQKISSLFHLRGRTEDGDKSLNEALIHYQSAGLEASDFRLSKIEKSKST